MQIWAVAALGLEGFFAEGPLSPARDRPMTQGNPDERAKAAAIDFARRLVGRWQGALGNELLGAYLMGSLAHGGFSRRYSDIDLALVTTEGLSPQALDRLRSEAVALMERECVRPTRPTLEDIRRYLGGAPFASWAERARSFAAAETLVPKDHKAYLRTLLYPGRLCYSWMTGRMGSNDDAVAFLSERPAAGLDLGLLGRALECRHSAADPDGLFAARKVLPSQVEACAALLSAGS
jgi:predicted nucleotidyltransferase